MAESPEEEDVGDAHLSLERAEKAEQRYGGKIGLALSICIRRDWFRFRRKHVAWNTSDGKRALRRHPKNQKGVMAVSEETATRIETTGVQEIYRGKLILQAVQPNATHPDCEEYWVISGGTLSDAMYIAAKRSPCNEQVVLSMELGIEEAVEVRNPCPDDIIEELVDSGNDYHDGVASTFLYALEKSEAAEAGWEVFKKRGRFTKATCPPKGKLSYDQRYDNYMKEAWFNIWTGKWQRFEFCKVAYHSLTSPTFNVYDELKEHLSAHVLYNAKLMPENPVMWAAIHALCLTLKGFDLTISLDVRKVLLCEFIKMMCVTKAKDVPMISHADQMKRLCKGFTMCMCKLIHPPSPLPIRILQVNLYDF